jgi:hypothetical protein
MVEILNPFEDQLINFRMNGIAWGREWRFIIQKHRKSVIRFGDGLRLRSSVRRARVGPAAQVMSNISGHLSSVIRFGLRTTARIRVLFEILRNY